MGAPRVNAMAVEIALAIPPGKQRLLPKWKGQEIAARYGVGNQHPLQMWAIVEVQIADTGELDLTSMPKSGRSSSIDCFHGVRELRELRELRPRCAGGGVAKPFHSRFTTEHSAQMATTTSA